MPVDSQRKEYVAMLPSWRLCRDVIAGSKAIKEAGKIYLPSLSGQTEDEYGAYKRRAKFVNITKRTRDAMIGTVFHRPVKVDVPKVMEPHLVDITLADVSFEDFAVLGLVELVSVGRFGMLLDMQGEDTPVEKRRPYWVPIKAEQIINWRETYTNGDTVLTMLVIRECVQVDEADGFTSKDIDQFKVLRLVNGRCEVTLWRYKDSERKELVQFGPPLYPQRRGETLSFIPFIVVNATSMHADPEDPPLEDMAHINVHMYMQSADLEHGRHFTGLPTPVAIGVMPGQPAPGQPKPKPLKIGSSEAWTLPPGGDAKFLEFTGKGLSELREGIKECKEEMAALGAEMFADDVSGDETATAVRVRHSAKTANLSTMVRWLKSGLLKFLRMHAWWSGVTQTLDDEAITLEISQSFFDAKMTPEELKGHVLLYQAGGCSFETLWTNLQKGLLAPEDRTAEEEKSQIDAEMPDPVDEADPEADPAIDPAKKPTTPAPKPGPPARKVA